MSELKAVTIICYLVALNIKSISELKVIEVVCGIMALKIKRVMILTECGYSETQAVTMVWGE